jgi:hypothetical protein
MAALSGRPAPPKRAHRSALPGLAFLVIVFLLLGYSGGTGNGAGSGGAPELVLGIVALIPAVILLAPFFLAGLGRIARRTPVAVRIALRDLARYRARSGSALAAVSIGVMIAVIITAFAQARYSDVWDPAGPDLASNQALIWIGPPNPSARAVNATAKPADRVGAALGAQHVAALEQTSAGLLNSSRTKSFDGSIDIATPHLLQALGIGASEVDPDADIVTSLPGFAGASCPVSRSSRPGRPSPSSRCPVVTARQKRSPSVLSTGDCDRACRVCREGREITRVAGEDDRAGARAGECGYDGVGCGDRRGPASGGAQPRRLAGVRLGHVPDLAGAK